MPALPLDTAGKYVAAAYLVVLALVLIYVVIMAVRQQRLTSELTELLERAERRDLEAAARSTPEPAERAAGDLLAR